MAISPGDNELAFLDAERTKRIANRVASFTDQEMVNTLPGNRTCLSKNLQSWECIGHPVEKTCRFRSHEDCRYTRQSSRLRQFVTPENEMVPGVLRIRRPIDGHIMEELEIMSDNRSFPSSHSASGNCNHERIGILAAMIRT